MLLLFIVFMFIVCLSCSYCLSFLPHRNLPLPTETIETNNKQTSSWIFNFWRAMKQINFVMQGLFTKKSFKTYKSNYRYIIQRFLLTKQQYQVVCN